MANNPILDMFRIRDLRERIFFTLGTLAIFRIGTVIPVPGINVSILKDAYAQSSGSGVSVEGFLDFFSGGAFSNFSIFMLGIMPYISVSIVMQLLLLIFPKMKRISQEEGGRKKINQWTRIGTIPATILQTLFTAIALIDRSANAIVIDQTFFVILAVFTVSVGTIFLMWLGEQINQRGIGNGISLIIFAGIVARLPHAIWQLFDSTQRGDVNPVFLVLSLLMFVVVVVLVIYEQRGQRKIPVHYAKRVVGRRMTQPQNTYIPFKINPSGVIPVIFASAILSVPLFLVGNTDAGWARGLVDALAPGHPVYLIVSTLLIVFFAFFYTQVSLNPIEISRQIRENGGSIPGIRSEKMEEYLTRVLNRIVFPGALFLAFIALIPAIVQSLFNLPAEISYLMGGTSLLILVGVDLDLMAQIEGQLRMHHHGGFSKKGKLRSRNL